MAIAQCGAVRVCGAVMRAAEQRRHDHHRHSALLTAALTAALPVSYCVA